MVAFRRPSLPLILLCLLLLFHVGHTKNEGDEYIYVKGDTVDPSFPIIEYKTPAAPKTTTTTPPSNVTDRPDFLYNASYPNPRIVEFYAPWCPHCKHFRESFIAFAGNITKQFKALNVTLQVIAISCMAHRTLCHEQGIMAYPRIMLYPARSVNRTEVDYWVLHPFKVYKAFGIQMKEFDLPPPPKQALASLKATTKALFLRAKGRVDHDPISSNNKIATSAPSQRHAIRTKDELYSDIHATFDFAMRNSIFMEAAPLTEEQGKALLEWLHLLQLSLPPFWNIQNVITALLDNFETVRESEAGLLRVIAPHPPPSRRWSSACSESGYTCGLWTMFHTMTVGVVEYNKLALGSDHFPTGLAAEILRDYIKHFFACDVCRKHFLQEFEACSHDRCNRLKADAKTTKEWMELPLWLFEEHNGVNVRLFHENAERKKLQVTSDEDNQVIWPSREDCPNCWLDDQRWDEDDVYRYLRINYWIHDAESVAMQRELFSTDSKKARNDDEEGDGIVPHKKWFRFSLATVVMILLMLWYQKEARLRRSGYHKKNEG